MTRTIVCIGIRDILFNDITQHISQHLAKGPIDNEGGAMSQMGLVMRKQTMLYMSSSL